MDSKYIIETLLMKTGTFYSVEHSHLLKPRIYNRETFDNPLKNLETVVVLL